MCNKNQLYYDRQRGREARIKIKTLYDIKMVKKHPKLFEEGGGLSQLGPCPKLCRFLTDSLKMGQ